MNFGVLFYSVLIRAGEWWKKDVMEIERNATIAGGGPLISDAYMINGQPGDLYPCSKSGTNLSAKQTFQRKWLIFSLKGKCPTLYHFLF